MGRMMGRKKLLGGSKERGFADIVAADDKVTPMCEIEHRKLWKRGDKALIFGQSLAQGDQANRYTCRDAPFRADQPETKFSAGHQGLLWRGRFVQGCGGGFYPARQPRG